ncbi:MAG: hypothetical protein V4733_09385 [Verrucomicrobiota bacterium]
MPENERKPWWLLPNLLSLDAPIVALVWLYIYERCWRLYIPWYAYVSLGLAVWAIYAADRLFDVAISEGSNRLEPRHEFHRKHRNWFRTGALLAFVSAALLTILRMPSAIYIYLGAGAVLVAAFFGLAMVAKQERIEIPYLKNIIAGVTFAYGTAMTANLFRGEFNLFTMLRSTEFISFAVLCVLNISAIDLWEHAARAKDEEIAAADELALTLPLTLLGGTALVFALRDEIQTTRPFFYAILVSTALLYILNRNRPYLSTNVLRVLADAALIVPVFLVLPGN